MDRKKLLVLPTVKTSVLSRLFFFSMHSIDSCHKSFFFFNIFDLECSDFNLIANFYLINYS